MAGLHFWCFAVHSRARRSTRYIGRTDSAFHNVSGVRRCFFPLLGRITNKDIDDENKVSVDVMNAVNEILGDKPAGLAEWEDE